MADIETAQDGTTGPAYHDAGIAAYITDWGVELGDDDPQRSFEHAHHLWWNSKLPRGRFTTR